MHVNKSVLSYRELKELLSEVMLGCIFPGGMSASILSGDFGAMLFSRDLLRVKRNLMGSRAWRPLLRQMFSVLPQWQGVKNDAATNESPDAFQHQVFRQNVGGIQLPDELVEIVRYWTGKWGVSLHNDPVEGESFAIYNSSDAPALYLIALAEYIELTGSNAILKDRFYHRPTGDIRTVAEAASRCLNFMVRGCLDSEKRGLGGLYAIPNTNPLQTSPTGKLEDGFDSVIRPVWDASGSLTAGPVDYGFAAYIDHQALAVWAFDVAADVLFPSDKRVPEWRKWANHLRAETLRTFWMEDSSFFGVSCDKDGLSRLETVSALEVLNGTFLKGDKDAPDYVRALVRWAYSPEVLTPVGPVMTSRKFQPIWGEYLAYQGPGAVWPVRTDTVVSGFENWGLSLLVREMGGRNLDLLRRSGMSLEATYIDPKTNTPMYDPRPESQDIGVADIIVYPSSAFQTGQAWTASSGLQQLWREESDAPPSAQLGTWQHELERETEEQRLAVPPTPSDVDGLLVAADYARGENLKTAFAAKLGLSA